MPFRIMQLDEKISSYTKMWNKVILKLLFHFSVHDTLRNG